MLVGLVVVLCLCALDLHCSRQPEGHSTVARIASELSVGRTEGRIVQTDELAALARDFRNLAQRYLAQGEKTKAHRAIGAAQELDKKILKLRNER